MTIEIHGVQSIANGQFCTDCGVYLGKPSGHPEQCRKCAPTITTTATTLLSLCGGDPMTPHTPGSWTVDECPDASGFHTVRSADGTPNGNTEAEPIATVYEESDAALIAAAPDLLALVRKLCDVAEETTKDIIAFDGAHSLDSAIDAARALLARLGAV